MDRYIEKEAKLKKGNAKRGKITNERRNVVAVHSMTPLWAMFTQSQQREPRTFRES